MQAFLTAILYERAAASQVQEPAADSDVHAASSATPALQCDPVTDDEVYQASLGIVLDAVVAQSEQSAHHMHDESESRSGPSDDANANTGVRRAAAGSFDSTCQGDCQSSQGDCQGDRGAHGPSAGGSLGPRALEEAGTYLHMRTLASLLGVITCAANTPDAAPETPEPYSAPKPEPSSAPEPELSRAPEAPEPSSAPEPVPASRGLAPGGSGRAAAAFDADELSQALEYHAARDAAAYRNHARLYEMVEQEAAMLDEQQELPHDAVDAGRAARLRDSRPRCDGNHWETTVSQRRSALCTLLQQELGQGYDVAVDDVPLLAALAAADECLAGCCARWQQQFDHYPELVALAAADECLTGCCARWQQQIKPCTVCCCYCCFPDVMDELPPAHDARGAVVKELAQARVRSGSHAGPKSPALDAASCKRPAPCAAAGHIAPCALSGSQQPVHLCTACPSQLGRAFACVPIPCAALDPCRTSLNDFICKSSRALMLAVEVQACSVCM